MYIQPALPLAFSQIGQRDLNQDALYPAVGEADAQTDLFLVCDGMGGADKGEVASQLLVDAVASYARAFGQPVFDIVHLRAALDRAYAAYDDYLRRHPLVGRMGSTLALLQFHQYGATVAHIGDSRIYQVRAGTIIFQTKDHKQVNDMVEAGIITETQALTHPWRNRLSRAVMVESGISNGSEASSRVSPDVTLLTDVQAGDYFFLCTDGVLEQLDAYGLETLLAVDVPDAARLETLLTKCSDQTRDNYSGYLIGIESVTQTDPVRPVAAT